MTVHERAQVDDIREGKTSAPTPRALHDVHMTPEIQEYLERKDRKSVV